MLAPHIMLELHTVRQCLKNSVIGAFGLLIIKNGLHEKIAISFLIKKIYFYK